MLLFPCLLLVLPQSPSHFLGRTVLHFSRIPFSVFPLFRPMVPNLLSSGGLYQRGIALIYELVAPVPVSIPLAFFSSGSNLFLPFRLRSSSCPFSFFSPFLISVGSLLFSPPPVSSSPPVPSVPAPACVLHTVHLEIPPLLSFPQSCHCWSSLSFLVRF